MKNKLKAIGILVSLSLLWYGLYFVTSFYNGANAVDSVEIETQIVQEMNNTVTEVVWEDLEPIEGTCPECVSEEEVLGTATCDNVFNELVTTPVFIHGSSNVDFKDGSLSGDMVSKNAKIEVSEVTAPSILLTGSCQVKDSNKQISLESAALPGAGELFDLDYGRHNESPSSAKDYDSKINSSLYDEEFGSKTAMGFADSENSESEADINVGAEDAKSMCPAVQKSYFNSDQSNAVAEEMNAHMSIPGGETRALLNDKTSLDEYSGRVEDLPKAQTACKRKVLPATAQLFAKISASLFNHCNTQDENGNYPDDCIRVEDIVIRTNSFFGDYESCREEGICINTFMNRRSMSFLSPVESSKFDQTFLITTPCKVRVDGVDYSVKCLWDVSYIALEYYNQWQMNYPGEEYPVWEVYWEAIEKDILEGPCR